MGRIELGARGVAAKTDLTGGLEMREVREELGVLKLDMEQIRGCFWWWCWLRRHRVASKILDVALVNRSLLLN